MKNLEACISKWFAEHKVTSLAIRIGRGDEILWEHFQSNERELTDQTLFDMASVTKMAATTSLTLIALDRGMLHLDTPVSQFWPVPEDKKNLKIFHLLTHTLGFGHQKLFEPDVEYGLVQVFHLCFRLSRKYRQSCYQPDDDYVYAYSLSCTPERYKQPYRPSV